ncbi:hypothetical protein NT6N_07440 [Oceaniferula spumae]|uniref:Tetratricopeptide repeat protein n=1 Tax=Oceaniferula spumae TaxID=2979115 RepID=A0AAT9FIA8_9BACT
MNIRSLTTAVLLLATGPIASALDAPARLMFKDGSHDDVLIVDYKRGYVTYKLNERDLNRTRKGPEQIESIYFYQSPIFAEAMSLYQGRKYAEAKTKFQECQEAYKTIDTAPNNYGTLGGFYAMECSRRMMDLESLSSEMEKFRKEGLTRENHIQQLEVNAFWEAVRLKDWDRLDRLAQDWRTRKVTGSQRAQISYCHGLALEELAKKNPKLMTKALNAYNITLSADFTASMELVVGAANNALRIYDADPEVKLAIKLWKTEDENQNSGGYQRLMEANALAKLYNQAGFSAVKPLSAEYKVFLKYNKPKEDTAG